MQVLTDPTGFPLWVSEVRPGSSHDLTAAREMVVPLLYPHVPRGLPVLVDERYTGAGVDIRVPIIGLRDAPMTLAPYPRLPLTYRQYWQGGLERCHHQTSISRPPGAAPYGAGAG